MRSILFRAIGIWLVIVVVAILNGVFREKILVPAIGPGMALPLSGILLAVLVFLVTLVFVSFVGSSESKIYVLVGILWIVLTLFFEFLFGHYIVGKSWREVMLSFNIMNGDLFIVVLFISAISPWTAAKLRGVL